VVVLEEFVDIGEQKGFHNDAVGGTLVQVGLTFWVSLLAGVACD
jgi:hypothetical protein